MATKMVTGVGEIDTTLQVIVSRLTETATFKSVCFFDPSEKCCERTPTANCSWNVAMKNTFQPLGSPNRKPANMNTMLG